MNKVKNFQVDDLGVENCQYFQGYGVAFTPYTNCAVGIGDNPAEALDDCLEQIATSFDIDVEDLEARILAEHPDFLTRGDKPSVSEEDMYYYIGIKWSEEQ
jgi:hypothetical protein